MKRIVLIFGLIAGGILSVMMMITMPFHDQFGWETGAIIGYTTMVLAFLMIFVGTRSYRDNVAGGKIGFGRAFAVGILITAVASACYVATWEVLYYNFLPDFADKYAQAEVKRVTASGGTQAQIEATVKKMADFKVMYDKPLYNVSLTFLEPLPVGLLITLITAGVLSRKRKPEALAAS
jgi:hypothetical protein